MRSLWHALGSTETAIPPMRATSLLSLLVLVGFSTPTLSHAVAITLPGVSGYQRTATLDSATVGYFGTGPGNIGAVEGVTGLDVTASDGFFSVNLLTGSWGASAASGTWAIAPSFWSTFGDAVISMHVGNGGGDPDFFVWLVEQGQTSGTWSYTKLTGGGGGLSNLHLYGYGAPTNVPDSASTLALLALGLGALAFVARRRA